MKQVGNWAEVQGGVFVLGSVLTAIIAGDSLAQLHTTERIIPLMLLIINNTQIKTNSLSMVVRHALTLITTGVQGQELDMESGVLDTSVINEGSQVKIGGRLADHFSLWKSITHSKYILQCIRGAHIPFAHPVPVQSKPCPELHMNADQKEFVDKEIEKLLKNQSIKKLSKPLAGGWVSNIFLIPKKEPGKYQLILNLKSLNEHVKYTKFKMDHIEQVLNMIFPGAWLSSVDLTQAFNHIKISSKDYGYLMFTWRGLFYCYICAPNGLSNCPYMFSKICKPLLGHLRRNLVDILIYIDDTILVADSVDKMYANIRLMLDCFRSAGFIVNAKKSCLEPTQRLTFLGFVIDTVKYTILLTDEKRHDIHGMTLKILHHKRKQFSIKFIAKLVGKIVTSFPSSEHEPLHYRPLD